MTRLVQFVKGIYTDMHHTRLESDLRRLNKRIAVLELKLSSDSADTLDHES